MVKQDEKFKFKGDVAISYKQVLEEINGKENNLLVANGFNSSLGVFTSYENIFKEMMASKYGGHYIDVENKLEECNYDLEKFISSVLSDVDSKSIFLKKYISNKIKLDFMNATQKIVSSCIKNVYSEKNAGVHILLKNFNNYFTLNFDPFLYLFLLHFKKHDENNDTVAMQLNIKYINEDLNINQNDIYKIIKNLKKNGIVHIGVTKEETTRIEMSKTTKNNFIANVNQLSKEKKFGWKNTDIEKVVNQLLNEEKNFEILEFNDGFNE